MKTRVQAQHRPATIGRQWFPHRFAGFVFLVVVMAAWASPTAAQTWTGGGSSVSWSDAANWSSLPSNAGYLYFSGTTNTSSFNNQVGTVFSFNFTNDGSAGKTSAFTLSGNNVAPANGSSSLFSTTAIVNGGTPITDEISMNFVSGVSTISGATLGANHNLKLSGRLDVGGISTISGAGVLIITNTANTWNGITMVANNARVDVTQLLAGTTNASGSSASITLGQFNTGGTIGYIGTGGTATKRFTVGNGTSFSHSGSYMLLNNGSGTIAFTSGTFNVADNTVAPRTLTLGGTSGFAADIQGTIINNGTTGGAALSITKSDSGRWILSGSNAYSGVTTLSAGQLDLNNANAIGSGALTISGGTLGSSRGSSVTLATNNTLTLGGNFSFAGPNDLDLGTGAVTMAATRIMTVDAGRLTIGGAIASTSAGLTKSGTGTLRLTGANANTGVTTVNGGVLEVASIANGGSSSSLGSSGSAAANLVFGAPTATLRFTGSTNATTNRSFTMSSGGGGGATIESSGAGTLSFDNTVALAYGTNNEARVLTLGGTNADNNTFAKVLANNGTGTTSLTKAGTGRWVLSGANTYSGVTAVDAGVLTLGANNTIPNGSAVTIGTGSSAGGLDLAGFTDNVASITLTSGSIFGSGTLTATTYALNGGTVAASLGAGTVTVATGTTTLNAAAAATTFNVPSGRLVLGGNDRLAAGAAVTVSGGVLDMNGNTNSVNSFAISNGSLAGPGKLTSTTGYALSGGNVAANIGPGTVTVTGNAGLGGTTDATTVNLVSGTLTLGSAGRFASSAVAITGSTGAGLVLGGNETIGTLAGNASVDVASFRLTTGAGGNSSFAGALAGAGGLTKVGSSVFTLSGANTYSGQTIISGGTLALASGGSFTNSSKIIVGDAGSSGVVLDLSAKAGLSGSFTLAQGQTLMGKGTVDLGGGNLIAQGVLAPGNSPGNLGVTGNLVWTGTAAQGYQWEINNATGSAGTAAGGWDVISVSGMLDLSALSASNQYFLDLITLDPTTNLAGQMTNYVDGSSYNWNLLNASSVLLASGTAAAGTDVTSLFNVSFANWANPAPAPGNYSIRVADDGAGINLVIVPEPYSLVIAALGLGIVSWSRLRRRQT